jgi:hypothetical protein
MSKRRLAMTGMLAFLTAAVITLAVLVANLRSEVNDLRRHPLMCYSSVGIIPCAHAHGIVTVTTAKESK